MKKLPHNVKLKLPQPKNSPHEMKSPQLMPSGGNKQTGFTDEYCRMLIDQELAQVTIQKTLNTFRNLLQNRRTSISYRP